MTALVGCGSGSGSGTSDGPAAGDGSADAGVAADQLSSANGDRALPDDGGTPEDRAAAADRAGEDRAPEAGSEDARDGGAADVADAGGWEAGGDRTAPADGPGSDVPLGASYSATFVPGGLDRVFIMKSDPTRDLCFRIVLASPGSATPGLAIELPDTWRVESAMLMPSGTCEPRQTPAGYVRATGASGRISWSSFFCPRVLDIDVTLSFTPGDNVPATERLLATGLRTTGC